MTVLLLVNSRLEEMSSWLWSSYLVRLYGCWVFSRSLLGDTGVKVEVEEQTGDLRGRGGGGDSRGKAVEVKEE